MRIIIVGASAIGSHLARLLSRSNHDIVLMDESEDKLDAISSEYDLMTLTGSPTEIKALRSADTDLADIFQHDQLCDGTRDGCQEDSRTGDQL